MGENSTPTWRTAISHAGEDRVLYRGYDLLEILGELDFASAAYLIASGDLPSDGEVAVFNALLTSSVDHGISPSQAVTRFITASGTPIQGAVAGGLLTYGDHHGGASSITARLFTEALDTATETSMDAAAAELVDVHLEADDPVPGFHHPMHPDGDPRVDRIFDVADEHGVAGEAVDLTRCIEDALYEKTGKELKTNMDGAAAAIVLDLGFSPTFARGVFLIARSAGLVAHAIEEATREDPWRLVEGDIEYDGQPYREIDEARE